MKATPTKDATVESPSAPPHEFTDCPHWGKGGRYTYDPATGVRTPVVDQAETTETTNTDSTPTVKDKRNG